MTNNNGCRNPTPNDHRKPPKTDRLSTLPLELIIVILSLLPIKDAVATSVISRSWRGLWTHITRISLHPDEQPNFDDPNYFLSTVNHILPQIISPKFDDPNYFLSTVSHILPQIISPKIDTFDLSYRCFPIMYGLKCNLIRWFELICVRNPEKIKVDFCLTCRVCFSLPTYLFTTQSLVYLKLHLNFEFNSDILSLVNLPNLKKLRLLLGDHNWDVLGLLFKSCPLLEDLKMFMHLVMDGHLIEISSPNLKRLLISLESDNYVVDNVTKYCKIVINTPNLEYLNIQHYLAFYEFISTLSNLQEVVLEIDDEDYENYEIHAMGLFQGISSTRSLIMEDCGYTIHVLEELINLLGNWLPIFNNLKHLRFSNRSKEEIIPRSLLANLKELVINEIEFEEYEEIELVRYILSKAPVIEKIKLMHTSLDSFDVSDQARQEKAEYEFCNKIFMLPSISQNCEIEICGHVIRAIHTF